MTKPLITIAVQCHNFQRRFCWMLSSLAQQTNPSLLVIDVAHVPANGKPSTEEACALFSDRLVIRRSEWLDRERFQYRGLVRNNQLQQCDTDWLLFGDCDMVYHPAYFARLAECLGSIEHSRARYMLSSGRISNPKEQTNALVNQWVPSAAVCVPEAWEKADAMPKNRMRNVGAGFCQLINMEHCPHEGYYVRPAENRDHNWTKRGSNPRSDVQFRRRISAGGNHRQALPEWFSTNAIHLNHDRDPEAGHHLEHQR